MGGGTYPSSVTSTPRGAADGITPEAVWTIPGTENVEQMMLYGTDGRKLYLINNVYLFK